jgi:hypothetical protein
MVAAPLLLVPRCRTKILLAVPVSAHSKARILHGSRNEDPVGGSQLDFGNFRF